MEKGGGVMGWRDSVEMEGGVRFRSYKVRMKIIMSGYG
jgi:hypothetical protein